MNVSIDWPSLSRRFPLGDVQFVSVGGNITVANLIGQHGVGRPRGTAAPPIRHGAIREGWRRSRLSPISMERPMPRIGCGLAGGTWEEIEPIIEATLLTRNIQVRVYDFP